MYILTMLKYYTIKQMHSRDKIILIVLLWFSIMCTTSACFNTFFIDLVTIVPTPVMVRNAKNRYLPINYLTIVLC